MWFVEEAFSITFWLYSCLGVFVIVSLFHTFKDTKNKKKIKEIIDKHEATIKQIENKYEGIIKQLEISLQQEKDRREGMMKKHEETVRHLEQRISDYKERLGLAPKHGSRYSLLTHAELKAETLSLVAKLRRLRTEYDEEATKIAENSRHWIVNGQTEEEKDIIRVREKNKEVGKLFSKCIAEYKKRFMDDTIILRDELFTRLSEKVTANRKCNDAIYDSPPAIVCIGWIADELAIWAKMLC